MGSTREARRAGSHEATATPRQRTMTEPSQINGLVAGSSGHAWRAIRVTDQAAIAPPIFQASPLPTGVRKEI